MDRWEGTGRGAVGRQARSAGPPAQAAAGHSQEQSEDHTDCQVPPFTAAGRQGWVGSGKQAGASAGGGSTSPRPAMPHSSLEPEDAHNDGDDGNKEHHLRAEAAFVCVCMEGHWHVRRVSPARAARQRVSSAPAAAPPTQPARQAGAPWRPWPARGPCSLGRIFRRWRPGSVLARPRTSPPAPPAPRLRPSMSRLPQRSWP